MLCRAWVYRKECPCRWRRTAGKELQIQKSRWLYKDKEGKVRVLHTTVYRCSFRNSKKKKNRNARYRKAEQYKEYNSMPRIRLLKSMGDLLPSYCIHMCRRDDGISFELCVHVTSFCFNSLSVESRPVDITALHLHLC